jgi:hypothetical protein
LVVTGIEEIKSAISKLSLSQRGELVRWLHGWVDDDWDDQMTADARAGRLDRLIAEAESDESSNATRELP